MFCSRFINIIKYQFRYHKKNRKEPVPFKRWQIVRGDIVKVRAGADKGKIGKVLKVYRKINRVSVRGVNVKTKKQRLQSGQMQQIRKSCSIHVSNVGLYDSTVGKAVRIKYGFHPETNEKLRISRKSGKIMAKPSRKNCTRQRRGRNKKLGVKDTPANTVLKVTYQGEDFEKIKREFQQFIAQKQRKERFLVF